ncbi:hypothetical protein [Streptomyces sp. NBC_01443]|uniref:hypothetical protein n=1 Tax=Streptomyces sp. NBC_01443 TaxID=2903868 RepID=UPI00225B08D7|nr:hypothetical protein [Streptomyces sp. NBC_01443]MCX4629630.1 hypothetical protein [Streptomyces sp. NBC_01443]
MRPLSAAVVGLVSLGVLAAGCTPSEPDDPQLQEPKVVSATQVCGGTLFTPEAGKALERVLQSTEFVIREDKVDLSTAAMAKKLEEAYRSGKEVRNMPMPDCDISGKPKEIDGFGHYPSAQVRFKAFSKNAGIPDYVPGATDSGVNVGGRIRQRSVAFDCVSPRVGSTAEVPLRITATFFNKFDKGNGDEAVLDKDYFLLVHTAALSMAEELGCANNGGLPDRADALPPMNG